MKPASVAGNRLEGVGECVTVVQHHAQSRFFTLVFLNDIRLETAAADYDLPNCGRVPAHDGLGVGFRKANKSATKITPYFTKSARPLQYSRSGSVGKVPITIQTPI